MKENKNLKIINDHNENELNDLNKKKHNLKKFLLKTIEQLNKELAYLNKKIKKDEKEKDEKSQYEDEIVIINKKCTFRRGRLAIWHLKILLKKILTILMIKIYSNIMELFKN